MNYVDEVLAQVKAQNPNEPEFYQTVEEVLNSVRPVVERNEAKYRRNAILERLVVPDRAIMFRVASPDI